MKKKELGLYFKFDLGFIMYDRYRWDFKLFGITKEINLDENAYYFNIFCLGLGIKVFNSD